MSTKWDKKIFRFSENDVERLDSLVEKLNEEAKTQEIKVLNRTVLIRALIMMSVEKPKIKKLMEYVKLAHVYLWFSMLNLDYFQACYFRGYMPLYLLTINALLLFFQKAINRPLKQRKAEGAHGALETVLVVDNGPDLTS